MKLNIMNINHAHLQENALCVEEKSHKAHVGAWAFYVPQLGVKLLHAVDGKCHCIHHSAPNREALFSGKPVTIKEVYNREDWESALAKSPIRRAVENFVASKRLYQAGLGPAVYGICVVREFSSNYDDRKCVTSGIMLADLTNYPTKKNTTAEEMIRAGVFPDRIRSCIRQQINGYISDLNSVVGVMPIDAESEIERLLSCVLNNYHGIQV